jgi:light-regulated signal transduction histidine kinase (bacteriophytochrome)
LDADALISRINGAVTSHGATIPPDALPAITGKLQSLAARGVSSCDKLELLHPAAAAFAHECSGALYIDLGRRSGDYLLFVRGEFVRTVNWAGNPDKAAMADGDGKLHPRTSFAAWQDTVRGRARPWTVLEIDSASFIREQLIHIRNAERLRELEALEAESESF